MNSRRLLPAFRCQCCDAPLNSFEQKMYKEYQNCCEVCYTAGMEAAYEDMDLSRVQIDIEDLE